MTTYSLHLGCNELDVTKYPPIKQGWHLPGSFESAKLFSDVVKKMYPDCTPVVLKNPAVADVAEQLTQYTKQAMPGDLVIFSYTGHGAQIPTKFKASANKPTGTVREKHLNFEVSILLWDRMMIANEFGRILVKFRKGVNLVCIIDACDSGTFLNLIVPNPLPIPALVARTIKPRREAPISMAVSDNIFTQLNSMNAAIYKRFATDPGPMKVRGVYFGACADGEVSYQEYNGSGSFFSLAISQVLSGGKPCASYAELQALVAKRLHRKTKLNHVFPMNPQLYAFGTGDDTVLTQKPFS